MFNDIKMKDIKKIDVTKKIKLPTNPVEEKKKNNKSLYLLLIFICGGFFGYYILSSEDSLVVSKPKKKAVISVAKKEVNEKKKIDYKNIILTQKCLTSSVQNICKKLSSIHPLSGIEGAYSIADILYITLNTHSLDQSLLNLKPTEIQKKKELDFFVKNYSRKMHPLKFKKQNYVYQKLDLNKDYAMANLVSILSLSNIAQENFSGLDEIVIIEFDLNNSQVTQDFIIKEKVTDFLKKISVITELDIIMYYYSGIYTPLNNKISSFKVL